MPDPTPERVDAEAEADYVENADPNDINATRVICTITALARERDEALEVLHTLQLVVGLTAFKHPSQRAALQEAVDAASALLSRHGKGAR